MKKLEMEIKGRELENLGDLLRGLRRRKNLTQAEVAEMIGISTQHYSRIERGMYTPGLQTFLKIAEVLDFDIRKLKLNDGGKMTPVIYEIVELLERFNNTQQKNVLAFLKTMEAIV